MPSSKSPEKFVYFDLGKVLIDFDHSKAFSQIAKLSGSETISVADYFVNKGIGFQYESGKITSEELHAAFCKSFKTSITAEALAFASSDIFTPKLETIAIAETLNSKGQHIGILSNTSPAHWQYCQKHYDFISIFKTTILSFEVKSIKPEKAIYQAAIKKSGVAPKNCFFVDDLAANVEAAAKAGMHAVQFQSAEKLRSDLKDFGIIF